MATNSFYRTPYLTTISFVVGMLLFLLPFVEIKCSGTTLAQMKGLDMVTGASPEVGGDFKRMSNVFDEKDSPFPNTTTKTKTTDEKGKVYMAALVALGLGVIGLIISLVKKGTFNHAEMLIGILGAVALIVLMIQVKGDVSDKVKTGDKQTEQAAALMNLSVDFTIWFYLCVLSYLSAAFFSYKQKQLVVEQELPPANAPQIHINNPGDQSDFPPSATGEKDLG